MFFQVGYGLERVLPRALCTRIIYEQIAPRFEAGDCDGGLTAGVQSVIAAAKGEYKGTGATVADSRTPHGSSSPFLGFGFIVLLLIIIFFARGSVMFFPGFLLSSSGSSRGWGGGGFSSGGGSFGGGGAGGSW